MLTAFVAPVSSTPPIKSGKLRALVIAAPNRSPALPDVPTTAEAGLPDLLIYASRGKTAGYCGAEKRKPRATLMSKPKTILIPAPRARGIASLTPGKPSALLICRGPPAFLRSSKSRISC
ncbi:MAG: hypothetical protein HY525_07645 [Betaproteobacteria bacterium]|nr:hypothetical protein [Betaproteobacteria bacterium]